MCALCLHPRCAVEHLTREWLFCTRWGFRYREANGVVINVGETQHSMPRKFLLDPRPILTVAKKKR